MSAASALPTTAPDSEEEAAVRETAREIASRCTSVDDHADCWKRLVDAGFLELRSAQDDGAPLADTTMTALVVQELAGATCGAPLVGSLLAAELVRLAGGEALEEPTTLLLGDDLSALATSGGSAELAWDAAAPVAQALRIDGDELVAVALGDREPTQDPSRLIGRPVGDGRRLGISLDAEARARFDSFAQLLLAADLLGTASGVLAGAVGYARDRVQFGVPIGTFQAVQHLCARAYTEVEAMRSAILYGAWALDAGRDHHEAALVAKAYAGKAGISIVETAIQVYGGVAITWEFSAHRHLRRALLDAVVFGDPDTCGEALLTAIATPTREG